MSTYLDDLSPALRAAYKLTGNQSNQHLRNMVKALQLFPALNTPDDDARLEAAKFILRGGK